MPSTNFDVKCSKTISTSGTKWWLVQVKSGGWNHFWDDRMTPPISTLQTLTVMFPDGLSAFQNTIHASQLSKNTLWARMREASVIVLSDKLGGEIVRCRHNRLQCVSHLNGNQRFPAFAVKHKLHRQLFKSHPTVMLGTHILHLRRISSTSAYFSRCPLK